METLLRIQINILCVVILLVALDSVRRSSPVCGKDKPFDLRIFELFIGATMVMLVTDAVGWLLDGMPGPAARMGLYASNVLYYAFHAAPTSLYLLYADFQFNRDQSRTMKFIKPLVAINIVLALTALSTPFTQFLFRLDESNSYERGWGFIIFAVFLYGLTALSFIPIAMGRGKTSVRVYVTLLAYPLPMLAAATAQALFFGLVVVWPVTTVFLLAATLNIQRLRCTTDHLTGTANRRSLDETLANLVRNAEATGKGFGGLLVDLDAFKSINDRFGHKAGDRALEDAVAILNASVRQDDFVARFGGDEFVLLLPGANSESLGEVSRRINALAGNRAATGERPYRLSFSVGAALYDPESDRDAAGYLAKLDKAMYADKLTRKAN
jgi:diguanylate cyclase (GGDEF)-like protein